MIPLLLEAALRALLVALAVWTGLRILRVRNVLAQKAAWSLMLAAALAMPWAMRWPALPAGAALVLPAHPLQRAMGRQPDRIPAASLPATLPTAPHSTAGPVPEAFNRFPAPSISSSAAPASSVSTPQPAAHSAFPRPSALALLLYLAVSAALLLRLIFGLVAALRLWLAAEPVSAGSLSAPSASLALGLRLRSSRSVASPITIGSGVVLPAEYTLWDAEKLRIVLAHERSHVRQGDFYLQTLARVYAIVFWFSPLGWWLLRKLSDLGETIGDRAALLEAVNGPSYARILLQFAAAPRPTLQGVAMASTSNLSPRIERLLDESIFHQAFAGGRRRALAAVLLVPAALFAATSLIRVEAAGQAQQPTPATGQSHPENAPDQALPAPAEPAAPQSPAAPEPPSARDTVTDTQTNTNVTVDGHGVESRGNAYHWSSNGDSYAIVSGPGNHFSYSGNWSGAAGEQIEKARKLAHGQFLWFTRNGKAYFLDDPAAVEQIESMYRPMEALGKQQEALGQQQREIGKQQEKLGHEMQQARVPTPEVTKELEELKSEMAKLKTSMGKTSTPEELAELGSKLGELGGRMGEIQGELGARQGEFGEQMGKLGEMQGNLGAEQGRLGAEQGKMAMEADRKVKFLIDQSLRDGKAHPVE